MSIHNIRDKIERMVPRGTGSATDLPPDHRLVFHRSPSEKWNFNDGHIFLNDEDIESVLDQERNNVRLQAAVSEALQEYRNETIRQAAASAEFLARIEAIQGKILSNMGRIWDEMSGGIRLAWGDGGYLLNNVNVRAILAMYHVRPTTKAKKFLEGLKYKLALILINKNGSSYYERINGVVKRLYEEVEGALTHAPIDVARIGLPSGTDPR